MTSMENGKQTHHSAPHVTGLDDLEVILNNLRGQQNLTQWGTKNKVQGVETPDIKLNMAVKEAQMKSLSMNGVKSLGNQQSQQSLVHESSTRKINEDAASSLESKRGFFGSLPVFSSLYQSQKKDSQLLDKKDCQLLSNISGVHQGKPGKEQRRRKQPANSALKRLKGENKPSNKDEKACKNGVKKPEKTCKNVENKPIKDGKACENGKNRPSKDEKACKKEDKKKRVPRNWLPKLFGC
ncbi:uncharacterized protein LOC123195538 [Mangifera indica]|uniref:uncharacterized protein LOC123195538 n=1 Tax=Mangifera indica TaxID=29780 RepID=UPI001CF99B39|nr:uncharacterized protein LOC123195538 [Mangifera indica]